MRHERTPALSELMESFFRSRLAAQRRASPKTIASYRDAMKLLLRYASEKKGKQPSRLSLEDIGRETILGFLDYLEAERGNCIRTRNARLAAIRSFFQHVAYLDPASLGTVQRVLGIQSKKVAKKSVEYLTKEELDLLLTAPERGTPRGRRDYVLLLFLSQTGARVSEAVGVNARDIRFDRPCQVLLHGKGDKDRVVPLEKALVENLRTFCAESGVDIKADVPVFRNARGQRMTRFGVIYILKKAIEKIALLNPEIARRSISPHTLRHTNAMHLLHSGVDQVTIRDWLGHSELETTDHYTVINMDMKFRALEKCGISEMGTIRFKPEDKLLEMLDKL